MSERELERDGGSDAPEYDESPPGPLLGLRPVNAPVEFRLEEEREWADGVGGSKRGDCGGVVVDDFLRRILEKKKKMSSLI